MNIFLRLLLLFTLIPLLELALLIEVGRHIGTLFTIGLVIFTGIVGALLAKSQGLAVLKRISEEFSEGRLPADELFDGLFILVGGALLLTPGLLTDTLGFTLILPPTRTLIKAWVKRKARRMIEGGRIRIYWR